MGREVSQMTRGLAVEDSILGKEIVREYLAALNFVPGMLVFAKCENCEM